MALKDVTSGQAGGLCTYIGLDIKRVSATPDIGNIATSTTLTIPRIGTGTAGTLEDSAYAGKGLQVRTAAGAVAADGIVAAGWLNRAGVALVAGNTVLTVAA
jgi:hypothetical protein